MGIDSTGVIVEDTGRKRNKSKKKQKKILKKSEVITDETILKQMGEASI